MTGGKKPVLLMLAGHEPSDDPRVDWAARTAGKVFDTTVFGLHVYEELSEREDMGEYRIIRFAPPHAFQPEFLLLLLRGLAEYAAKRAGLSRWNCLFYPILIIAMAIFVPLEILLRVLADLVDLVWSWRPAVAEAIIAQALWRERSGTAPHARVVSTWPRFKMFRDAIRHVFTTAQLFWTKAHDLPDIAVIYCNDLNTLLPGVLIAIARGGIKVVYDSHEYWPYSNVEALGIHVWFLRTLERILARRADAVLTISDPLAAELKRAYGLPSVEVVPNAEPWVESAAGTTTPGGEIVRLAAGRVSFLFQGNFAPQRGLEELLDAWTGVDPGKAVLFLRGPDSPWRRDIVARARRLGLLDRTVFVLPPVTVAELVSAAREVDVGIIPYKPDLPAYRYACPNKLSQYLHAGLAILCNNIGYVAGQIAAANCGAVYDSSNRESIIAAVMKLAEDREALESLKGNALAYGRDTFNWQVQSRPLASLLSDWAGELQERTVSAAAA